MFYLVQRRYQIDSYRFFCGCGGASEGLRQAGFDIELGLDIDQQASETFKANFLMQNSSKMILGKSNLKISPTSLILKLNGLCY
ncbi:DNA cytosine methyltransferase [Escherichia coli]